MPKRRTIKRARNTAVISKSKSRRASVDVAELGALQVQQSEGLDTVAELLSRAQDAQKHLLQVCSKAQSMQQAHDAEKEKLRSGLQADRDLLQSRLQELGEAQAQAQADLRQAVKGLRQLLAATVALPDPMHPLLDDDDCRDWSQLRQQVKDLIDRKGGEPADAASMLAVMQAGRALVECITGRMKLQSGRVRGLRKHLGHLQDDQQKLQGEYERLYAANEQTNAALVDSRDAVAKAEQRISALEDEVDQAQVQLHNQEQNSAELTARLQAEIDGLGKDLESAQGQCKALQDALGASQDLARRAERAAVQLAEQLVDLAAGEQQQEGLAEAPAIVVQREELEHLVSDAGDEFDDEIDDMFRDDLGEDLVRGARALVDAMGTRRQAVAEELMGLRAEVDSLYELNGDQDQVLCGVKDELQECRIALERSDAQLQSTQSDLEQLQTQAAERQSELNELRDAYGDARDELVVLRDKAQLAETLKGELSDSKAEVKKQDKALQRQASERRKYVDAQTRLARVGSDLASATDAALSEADLKVGGHVGRYAKALQKPGKMESAEDFLRIGKTVADVVDKVSNRLDHLRQVLAKRTADAKAMDKSMEQLQAKHDKANRRLQEQDDLIKELKADRQELGRAGKRIDKLEQQLEQSAQKLQYSQQEGKDLGKELRQARAELDELRAREEQSSASLTSEVAELKRRLQDEQQTRRQVEAELHDGREDWQASQSTLDARVAEYERGLDDRDQRIQELQRELDRAADQAATIKELQQRADNLRGELQTAQQRCEQLESELEDQAEASSLAVELDEVQSERDRLQGALRDAERRLADDAGSLAKWESRHKSLQSKFDKTVQQDRGKMESLQERFDALLAENRRYKEQNAGLNARVRSLTDY